jgi:gliding motility-associated-like protein
LVLFEESATTFKNLAVKKSNVMLVYPRSFKAFALVFLLLTLWGYHGQAQTIQDCLGAIPVCQKIYEEDKAPIGSGAFFDFTGDDNCLLGENNSIWYVFTVDKSGKFGFLLTPNDPTQDYDWILFDITNASCQDIGNDPSLIVSCNAAGQGTCNGPTGATGDTEYSNQGPNCGEFPPNQNGGYTAFNDLIDVQEGNTYVLCILNFSAASSKGYTLDFGLSTDIGIFDETPPSLAKVDYPGSCDGRQLTVTFSEFIQCSTISAENFELSGTGGPYELTLLSANCGAGGNYSKEFTLEVRPMIPFEASLTLELVVDGISEALDLCGNPAIPSSIELGGPVLTTGVDFGPDTTLCAGETLILDGDLGGGYFWSDGSNGPKLEVSKAGVYWLTINTQCGPTSDTIEVSFLNTGMSDSLLGNDTILCASNTIELDATTIGALAYQWQDGSTAPTFLADQPGAYAVTVTNECGELTDEVILFPPEPIGAEINDTSICAGASFVYDVTTPGATYEWQDGSTAPTFTVTGPGAYSVVITTPCETATRNATVTAKSGELTAINLGADTILCTGETLLLAPDVPADASLVWQDGSTGSTFQVDQGGVYSVTASNECGEARDEIEVEYALPVTAAIRDTALCSEGGFTYDVSTPGATYLWQDGSTRPTFVVTAPGDYSVVITTPCETATRNATVTAISGELTAIKLGADTILCTGETLLLAPDVPADASLVWQDGSTGSTFQVDQGGVYSVTASNECGEARDEIEVEYALPVTAAIRDTALCSEGGFTYDVSTPGATYLWQDGSTGPTYLVTGPGDYSVVITTPCETVTRSATVTAISGELTAINLGADTILCTGETLLLAPDVPADASLVWQDGSTGATFLVDQAGVYSVTASNECGAKEDEIVVQTLGTIQPQIPRDTSVCPGETVLVNAETANATSYRWSDGTAEPTLMIDQPGQYEVLLANACEEILSTIEVTACEQCNVYLPNAISPNGDGANDAFAPFCNCAVEEYNLRIFSRWGDMIYATDQLENGWNGTFNGQEVDIGVYLYVVELKVVENGIMKDMIRSGSITVVR